MEPVSPPNDNAEPAQLILLDLTAPWRVEWQGMPEFSLEDQTPSRSILVHFETEGDALAFHHYVDYSRWKTMPLKRRPGLEVATGTDNFGMVLQQKIDGRWTRIDRPKSEPKTAKYADPDRVKTAEPERPVSLASIFGSRGARR